MQLNGPCVVNLPRKYFLYLIITFMLKKFFKVSKKQNKNKFKNIKKTINDLQTSI